MDRTIEVALNAIAAGLVAAFPIAAPKVGNLAFPLSNGFPRFTLLGSFLAFPPLPFDFISTGRLPNMLPHRETEGR
jgi:hypothetical protein